MKTEAPLLAPILRSPTQGRLLAILFADPGREFTVNALALAAGTSGPTAMREVDRAEAAGLVTSRKVGQARQVRVDPTARFYRPMREIVVGAFGPPAVAARAFANLPGVSAVVLFGSWVARYLNQPGLPPADVDVLVIGDVDRNGAYDAAEEAERELGITVHVTVRSVAEWVSDSSFLVEVRSRPMLVVSVDEDDPALDDLRARMEAGR